MMGAQGGGASGGQSGGMLMGLEAFSQDPNSWMSSASEQLSSLVHNAMQAPQHTHMAGAVATKPHSAKGHKSKR